MKLPDRHILRLSMANARGLAAEWAYMNRDIDFTRPVQVYGGLNTACNVKCIMCGYWQQEPVELPASHWIRFLTQLHDFTPFFNINFSGGETLMKPDLFEILALCHKLGITSGITTNALLLSQDRFERLMENDIFNLNISLDSIDPEVHDLLRGMDGLCEKVKANIERSVEQRARARSHIRIVLKPIMCAQTLSGLTSIVRYAADLGLTGVHFQPITERTEVAKSMVIEDLEHLREVIEHLILMKKAGYPVMNSEVSLREHLNHFNGCPPARSACLIGLRNLFVSADGEMRPCHRYGVSLGNIQRDDIGQVWPSEKGRELRRKLVQCDRFCLGTCIVKRKPSDYVRLAADYMNI